MISRGAQDREEQAPRRLKLGGRGATEAPIGNGGRECMQATGESGHLALEHTEAATPTGGSGGANRGRPVHGAAELGDALSEASV